MKPRLDDHDKVEKVLVYCRLRPFTFDEYTKDSKYQTCIEELNHQQKIITGSSSTQFLIFINIFKKDFDKKTFSFDDLIDPDMEQEEVYMIIAKNVIKSVLKGFNGTIFAYGQTGAGKTYTMMGNTDLDKTRGIIPRALEHLFKETAYDKQYKYDIKIGYIQIYMEMLQDLIEPSNIDIKIRESPENGVFITGNEWISVRNVNECLNIISNAEKNRITAFTNLNAHSSRSHAVLMVKLERRLNYTSIEYQFGKLERSMIDDTNIIYSVLYLVDLAGSERVKKSKVTGDRLDEAISINYSLTALGKCIHALTDPKMSYIPFRESKLTRILQDSLGGNSKTVLIINIGPSIRNLEETLSALQFGSRAMKIQNKLSLNHVKDYYVLSLQLQADLDAKDDKLHKMEIELNKLSNEMVNQKKEFEILKGIKHQQDEKGQYLPMNNISQQKIKINEQIKTDEIRIAEEIRAIEQKYQDLMNKTEQEHKIFLEDIDKMMVEQENEINHLKDIIDKQNARIKELETENSKIKRVSIKGFPDQNNKIKILENEIESLKQKLIENLSEKELLLLKINDYEDQCKDLESKLSEMECNFKNEQAIFKQKEIDNTSRIKDLEDQLASSKEEINKERLENISRLTISQSEKDHLKELLVLIGKEKKDISKHDPELLTKICDLENNIANYNQHEKKDFQNQIDSLKKDKEDMQNRINQLLIDKEYLLHIENEQAAKIKELQKHKNELKEEDAQKEKKLQESLDHLSMILKDKEGRITHLNELIKEKDQYIMQLNDKIKEQFDIFSMRNSDFERDIRKKDIQIEQMKLNLAQNYQKKVDELENSIKLKCSETEAIKTEKEIKEKKIIELNEIISSKTLEIESLKNTLKTNEEIHSQQINEIWLKYDKLKENEDLHKLDEIIEFKRKISELSEKIKIAENTIEEGEIKIMMLERNNDENLRENHKIKEENANLVLKLMNLIELYKETKNVRDGVLEENKKFSEIINEIKEKNKQEPLNLISNIASNGDDKSKIIELNVKISMLANENQKLVNDNLHLKKQSISLENELNKLITQQSDLEMQYEMMLSQKIQFYIQEKENYELVIQKLNENINELMRILNEVKDENQELKKQMKSLENDKLDLLKALNDNNSKFTVLSSSLLTKEKQMGTHEISQKGYIDKISSLECEIMLLKQKNNDLQHEYKIKNLQQEIQFRRQQQECRNYQTKESELRFESRNSDNDSSSFRDRDNKKITDLSNELNNSKKLSKDYEDKLDEFQKALLTKNSNTADYAKVNIDSKNNISNNNIHVHPENHLSKIMQCDLGIERIKALEKEICELVLDNMIQKIEFGAYQSDNTKNNEQTSIYDFDSDPLKQWLKMSINSHIPNRSKFKEQKFNKYIEYMSAAITDLNSIILIFERFYNKELSIDINNKSKSSSSALLSMIQQQQQQKPLHLMSLSTLSKKNIDEEILNIMDYMIFVVEVENDIESKINIDLSMISLDKYVDNKFLNYNIFASPSKIHSRYFSRGTSTPKKFTNITEIPAIEIFNKRYNHRIQTIFQNFNSNIALSRDFIIYNTKSLQQILNSKEEFKILIGDDKDLILKLTNLCMNTYNLCLYLANKLQFKDKIINDLQGIFEVIIGAQTHKEIQLKIAGQEKKLLMRKFYANLRNYQEDQIAKSQILEEQAKYEKAARTIQAYYRKKREKLIVKMALIANHKLLREKENLERMTKNYKQFNARTGKLIINQSFNEISLIFSNITDTFTQKNSTNYHKLKAALNLKK